MHILLQISLAALIGSLSTLCVNFFTTKLRAKHDYRTHAQKTFFEKKLIVYEELQKRFSDLKVADGWIFNALKKDYLKCGLPIGKFEDRMNKFIQHSASNEMYLTKELKCICIEIEHTSRGVFSSCQQIDTNKTPIQGEAAAASISEIENYGSYINRIKDTIRSELSILGIRLSNEPTKFEEFLQRIKSEIKSINN